MFKKCFVESILYQATVTANDKRPQITGTTQYFKKTQNNSNSE
jgi:hypothetical protein